MTCLVGFAVPEARAACAGAKQECGWPIRPACCGSLKCELTAWPPECRHAPPIEGEACTIFSGCSGSDLYCKGFQDGLAGRCTRYAKLGDACDGVVTLCGDGLRCRQDPRNPLFNDPATIGDGRCFPWMQLEWGQWSFDWGNDDTCLAAYSPSLHRNLPAYRLPFGDTHAMSFGSGWGAQAGAAGSVEQGGVYGDDGSFGCYRQLCAGGGILGLAEYVSIAEYQDFKSASEGTGFQVLGGAAYVLGWSHAVLWDLDPSNPQARPVGEASAFSFGAQVGPDGQVVVCSIDTNVVVRNWQVITGPQANCRDVEECADASSCTADADIDAGSTATGGGAPMLSQIPPAPYPIGEQLVTLRVTDATGAVATCAGTVDVNDCTPSALTCRPTVAECQANRRAYVEPMPPLVKDCSSFSIDGPAAADYPLGSTPVTFKVTDAYFNEARCETEIRVVDTRPPEIRSITATPAMLWTPNHKLQTVQIAVDAADACDPGMSCKVVSVRSNEPDTVSGQRDDLPGDFRIVGPRTVELRAERLGGGSGRIYTVLVECRDTTAGNVSRGEVAVKVPHDQARVTTKSR